MKKAIVFFILSFWLAMAAAMARREWRLRIAAGTQNTYASALQPRMLGRQTQMGIYYRDARVGAIRVTPQERSDHFEIDSMMRVKLPFLTDRASSIHVISRVSRQMAFQGFSGVLNLPPLFVRMKGQVTGDQVNVTFTHENQTVFSTSFPFRRSDTITNVFSPLFAVPDLREGKTWQIRMFNPMTRSFEAATAAVESRETIDRNGTAHKAFRIRIQGPGLEAIAWVDRNGEVLKQSVPRWRIVLIKEDPDAMGF